MMPASVRIIMNNGSSSKLALIRHPWCASAKSLPLCLTLCDPMDCSPPGSSVHGILQARILGGLPSPLPWGLPNSGIKTASPAIPALQTDSLLPSHWRSPHCVVGPVLNSL